MCVNFSILIIMKTYNTTIVRTIDGDTIECNIELGFNIILQNIRVRLNGIDTPEVRSTNLTIKKFGLFVKNKVEDFLNNNKVDLIVYEEKDKFGRILGDFKTDNTTLCKYLIKNKYAVEYNGENKNNIVDIHIKNFNDLNII